MPAIGACPSPNLAQRGRHQCSHDWAPNRTKQLTQEATQSTADTRQYQRRLHLEQVRGMELVLHRQRGKGQGVLVVSEVKI